MIRTEGSMENDPKEQRKHYLEKYDQLQDTFFMWSNEKDILLPILEKTLKPLLFLHKGYIQLIDLGMGDGFVGNQLIWNIEEFYDEYHPFFWKYHVMQWFNNDFFSFSFSFSWKYIGIERNILSYQKAQKQFPSKKEISLYHEDFLSEKLSFCLTNEEQSNILLLSHVLYEYEDELSIVLEKLYRMACGNKSQMWMIHEDPTPIDHFLNSFHSVLHTKSKKNFNKNLIQSVEKDSRFHITKNQLFHYRVCFPVLSDSQWDTFASMSTNHNDDDKYYYRVTQHQELLEFFTQHLLQDLEPMFRQKFILLEWRSFLQTKGYCFILSSRLIVVSF